MGRALPRAVEFAGYAAEPAGDVLEDLRDAFCEPVIERVEVWWVAESEVGGELQPRRVLLNPTSEWRRFEQRLACKTVRAGGVVGDEEVHPARQRDVVPRSAVSLGMHGCAVGDVDGDGREDLYVGRVAGSPNLLLINGEGGRATEESAARGVDYLDDMGGALIVDMDGDGWRDLVMGRGIDVVIAWNEGQGVFGETTVLRRSNGARVYSLAAADFDGDGDLDLYDTRYFRVGGYGDQAPTPYHDARNGAPNHLWRNLHEQSPRSFRDDTQALGLDVDNDRFSLAAVWEDFDGDGDLDLYVANDFGRNNLYRNDGERFVDIAAKVGLVDMAAGMGVSLDDADLDGRLDLLVSNMWAPAGMRVASDQKFAARASLDKRAALARHARGNSLFRGLAGGHFRDVTESSSMGPSGWAWGARFIDWNRDGLPDVVSPNGFMTGRGGPDLMSFFWRTVVAASPARLPATDDYLAAWAMISKVAQYDLVHWNGREPTCGYLNLGELKFVDVSGAAGLDVREDGRAMAALDWDLDGRVDLWTKNRSAPLLRLMRGNAAPRAHWVAFELEGLPPNTDAVGALVEVTAGDQTYRKRVYAGDGFLAGSSLRPHFGLGTNQRIEEVRVHWPDGVVSHVEGVSPGSLWRVTRTGETSTAARILLATQPAMEADERPLDDGVGEPLTRVPLLDTFPLGVLRLPSIAGAAHSVLERAESGGLAVLLWHAGVEESRLALQAFVEGRSAFESAGVAWHALALDDVRGNGIIEAMGEALGAEGQIGRADRATRVALDMVLGRTLGSFDDLPLPIVLLFDARGELGLLQVGALDLKELLVDAQRFSSRPEGPSAHWPVELTGGHWDGPKPRRGLDQVAPKLRALGLPELADRLEASARARGY